MCRLHARIQKVLSEGSNFDKVFFFFFFFFFITVENSFVFSVAS